MTDTYQLTDEELESIRELAYGKYLARGCEDGYHLEDWLAAEEEIRNCRVEGKAESSVPEPALKKTRRAGQPATEAAALR